MGIYEHAQQLANARRKAELLAKELAIKAAADIAKELRTELGNRVFIGGSLDIISNGDTVIIRQGVNETILLFTCRVIDGSILYKERNFNSSAPNPYVARNELNSWIADKLSYLVPSE